MVMRLCLPKLPMSAAFLAFPDLSAVRFGLLQSSREHRRYPLPGGEA